MLRTVLILIAFSCIGFNPISRAQVMTNDQRQANPYSSLATLNGFSPSLLANEESANFLYRLLPTNSFATNSWCFQRAHTWSTLLEDHYSIKSMKVFLYFTDRYRREFAYPWYFHTAPVIPTVMKDGSIQELVFDPTFTSPPAWQSSQIKQYYDNKPISIDRWTRYFIYPNTQCKVIDHYQDFVEGQEKYYCYLMKTPMYNYSPTDFVDDVADETGASRSGSIGSNWFNETTGVRIGWRPGDLNNMKKGLKLSN